MKTRIMQRLQTLCCNIHLWHDGMIVCIQLGLPLPVLIAEIVVIFNFIYTRWSAITSAGSQRTIGLDMHSVTGALVLYAVEKKIAKE